MVLDHCNYLQKHVCIILYATKYVCSMCRHGHNTREERYAKKQDFELLELPGGSLSLLSTDGGRQKKENTLEIYT